MIRAAVLILYLGLLAVTRQTASITYVPTSNDVLSDVQEHYENDLRAFGVAISDMQNCSERLNSMTTSESCVESYFQLRRMYKSVEVILEYLDQETVHMYLNGPPLPALEKNVPEINVLEPEGMQVIDEIMLLEPEEAVSIEDLEYQLSLLKSRYDHIAGLRRHARLQHHQVWNAMRLSLIRLTALGITGFDTPGSAAGITDATTTLTALKQYLKLYKPVIAESIMNDYKAAIDLLDASIRYTELNDDFNSFDRMEFVREFIDPLFGRMGELQANIGIAFPDESRDQLPAVNLRAEHLFSLDLLDEEYFTGVERSSITKEQIDLGRTLFFDPVLSANLKRSCASCHDPNKAFTDGQVKSLAANQESTIQRNSPTLVNSLYAEHYFYDFREEHLERQIKHVVLDTNEFNTTFLEIVERLEQSDEYKELFKKAYPDHPYQLSKWSVSNALATYVASLSSFDTPVDQYLRGEIEEVPQDVYNGFNVFMGKAACGSCHFAPVFNGTVPPFYQHTESEVLGVPSSPDTINVTIDPDLGRMASGKVQDESHIYSHSFKTPTVRNISLTGPYMHNGVYASLDEVIDFYNRGGGIGLGMDIPNQTLPPVPLDLTEQEVSDLVAFMEALTDNDRFLKMPKSLPSFEGKPEWNKRKVGGVY